MYCTSCGARQREGAKFCHSCGGALTSLRKEETPSRGIRFKRAGWLLAILALAVACSGEAGPDLPELSPFDPDLTAKLHDIRAKVSEIRGLPPNQQATEGVVTREAFMQHAQKLVQELGEEEKAELEAQTVALRLLRLIRPEDR